MDDFVMEKNVEELGDHVVGHRIVNVENTMSQTGWGSSYPSLVITLDNGKRVKLVGSDDCCAYTELESFLLHSEKIDHMITNVEANDDYTKWHILADMASVLELTVGWSEGSGYYSYGFMIQVEDIND